MPSKSKEADAFAALKSIWESRHSIISNTSSTSLAKEGKHKQHGTVVDDGHQEATQRSGGGRENQESYGERKKKKKKGKRPFEGLDGQAGTKVASTLTSKSGDPNVPQAGQQKVLAAEETLEQARSARENKKQRKQKRERREESNSPAQENAADVSGKAQENAIDGSRNESKRRKRKVEAEPSPRQREPTASHAKADISSNSSQKKEQRGFATARGLDGGGKAMTPGSRPSFPFNTDESDHAETPFEAYEDVAKLLRALAKSLGVKPKALRIYDPYYCGGSVKQHLAALGFPSCYNEMEDFYAFAERGGPGPGEYDVLVTNPPYSGNHVERLFRFCAQRPHQPAFLLLPHFFYTEPYFKTTLGDPAVLPSLFFLCPGLGRRYRYLPPSWAAIAAPAPDGDTAQPAGIAPFPSFWYCLGGANLKALLKHFHNLNRPDASPPAALTDAPPAAASPRAPPPHPSASRLATFTHRVFIARSTSDLPNELKSEFDLGRKRPNPRARKKLAKQRLALSGGEGPAAPPPSSKRSALWRQRAQQRRREQAAAGGGGS